MKKVYAEIIAGMIPRKMARNRWRGILRYGIFKALRLLHRLHRDHTKPQFSLAVCAIAKDEAIKVKGLENKVGNHYYRALAALFDQDDMHLVFKYREVYRHLNTTSDVADVAMDSLLDVLMQ